MQFSLGPLQYFWPRRQTLDFYRSLLVWAGNGSLQSVYLGETVCSKRRELRFDDWVAIADDFAAAGIEPVLSTLALLEAESELGYLQINGIQIQTAEACDLAASAAQISTLGVAMVRLYPEQSDLQRVLARWRQALAGELLPTLAGHSHGYWEGDRARPRPVEIDA